MSESPSDPTPSTTVHLGDKGLSDGDTIDSYLDTYWNPDTHVIIPGGTYTINNRSLLSTSHWSQDAILEGESGADVSISQPTTASHIKWLMDGGSLCIRNITFTGAVGTASSPYAEGWTEAAQASDVVKFEEVEFPDGGNDDTRTKGMVVQPASTSQTHEGEAWFINCVFNGFADNGLYASYPGETGAGGSTHVRGGMYRNNNIANIRVGGQGDTVRHVTSIVDDPSAVPTSANGWHATRCLRVSGDGDNIEIADFDATATAAMNDWLRPVDIEPSTDGVGSGTIKNTRIRHDQNDVAAIRNAGAGSWSTSKVHITGSGDLTNELDSTYHSGSSCTHPPTTERKWWNADEPPLYGPYFRPNPNTAGDQIRLDKIKVHDEHPFQ